FATFAVLLAFSVPAHAAPADVDVLHYDVRLDVPLGEAISEGVETIRFRMPDESAGAVTFDAAGLWIESVREGRGPLRFAHEGERLKVLWTKPPRPGERRTIEVRYRFHAGRGLRTTADQAFTVFNTWGWMVVGRDPGGAGPPTRTPSHTA